MKIAPPKKGFNKYTKCDDYAIVYIERQTGEVLECLVDLDDLDRLIEFNQCWYATYTKGFNHYYAKTNIGYHNEQGKYKQRTMFMHKFVLDFEGRSKYIDHKNHNTLDNRKDNLIIVGQTLNAKNRLEANKNSGTGVRNVCWSNSGNRYVIQFSVNGKNTCFGRFKASEFEEAVKFAEEMRQKLYGKELTYLETCV